MKFCKKNISLFLSVVLLAVFSPHALTAPVISTPCFLAPSSSVQEKGLIAASMHMQTQEPMPLSTVSWFPEGISKKENRYAMICSFAAAFTVSLNMIATEVVLNNASILDYFLLELVAISGFTFLSLGFALKRKIFPLLIDFFPTLYRAGVLPAFIFVVLMQYVVRYAIYFYLLLGIGASGVSLIGASTLIFTPLLEFWILRQNALKPKYVMAYFLILLGIVGYKATSIPGWLVISLALGSYFFASLCNVLFKKIVEKVGDQARTSQFSVSVVMWSYLLSLGAWGVIWVALMNPGLGSLLPFLQGSSLESLSRFLTNPWMLAFSLLSIVSLTYSYYFDQQVRTVKHFPVSFLEASRQTRILFTAAMASGLIFMADWIPITLIRVPLTWGQWASIPLICGGAGFLTYLQWRESQPRLQPPPEPALVLTQPLPLELAL